jgi:hypothetical protein
MLRWPMLEEVLGVATSWGWPCLVAMSSWWSIWTGWHAPYPDLWPVAIQTRGQSFLLGAILSHQAVVGGGT